MYFYFIIFLWPYVIFHYFMFHLFLLKSNNLGLLLRNNLSLNRHLKEYYLSFHLMSSNFFKKIFHQSYHWHYHQVKWKIYLAPFTYFLEFNLALLLWLTYLVDLIHSFIIFFLPFHLFSLKGDHRIYGNQR